MVINIANQPNKDDDFLIDYHAERWCVAITQKIPVYCISKNIIRDFEQTEVVENEPFLPPDWVPRISNFILVFPNSVVRTPAGDDILYVFVSSFVGDPKDSTMFKKGLCLSQMTGHGVIFNTAFGVGDNGEILNREKLMVGSQDISKDETEFLKSFRALIIQTLLCLEYAPQYLEEPAVPKPSPHAPSKTAKKVSWAPRIIGANYVRRLTPISNTAPVQSLGDRQSPRMHHRKAYWRSQACGIKYQDRIPRWIMPTIVNKT